MRINNYTKFILTPNIFASTAWAFIVFVFAAPAFVRNILSLTEQSSFKENLFFWVAALLLIWNLMNEYTKYYKKVNRLSLFFKLSRWVFIPSLVLFLVIYNGVFLLRIKDINFNFSVFPIAVQMLLILILTDALKSNFFLSPKIYRKGLHLLLIFFLGGLNLLFCFYFTASWIAVGRYAG